MTRQLLANSIRAFAEQAIGRDDEKYGRQLATILENHSLRLRAYFGGKPAWAPSLRLWIRGKRKIHDE